MKDVVNELITPEADQKKTYPSESTGAAVGLSIENASWSAPRSRQTILHPISFDLAPARVLGVVGSNGAGKSTLLRLLYRYQAPTTGKVRINGTDIWSISAREVACTVAAVLQEQPTDFALTVREIVALGRTPHRKGFGGANSARDAQIVQSALDRLCLLEFADRQLGTLSGGERQRVMVARALAQEPRLLILDEPTNHLDMESIESLNSALDYYEGTLIFVSHDREFVSSLATRIIEIKDKKFIDFHGKYDEYLEKTVNI